MKLIERPTYMAELSDVMNTPDIKVITGVRRSGKSKLMEMFAQHVKMVDDHAHIIHIDFNLTEYEDLQEYHALEKFVEKHYEPTKNNYLIIDEVQMCTMFEKAINSLHAKEKYDIYVTGSNAFLQSSDLATLFVGRTYEIHILPFSFREYLSYYPSDNIYDSLTRYMTEGGMSGSYLYKDSEKKRRYIDSEVLNALIVRDIVNKYKIRNVPLLQALLEFLMDNLGNVTSVRSITDTLESNHMKADHKTIGRYVDYLCKAFAFYKVRRYDIKGKRYLSSDDKYYLSDHGFKYARLGTKDMDYGHVLENMVAIELLRRGYEVYVGVLRGKEIDFVAIKRGEKQYIQVSYDISNDKTFEREITPLLALKDAYPRTLIARTFQPEYQHEGIRVVDAAEWLNKKEADNGD